MRPHRISTVHWLSLLLIDLISYGLTENYNNQDFTKILSVPKKSLMETMIKKYSHPKNEVTAGVGYGHHLHPFYYQGEKKMMYPCAVECGEWETMMDADDSVNDASSNIDAVTVRPDVTKIEITTPKSRPYKDASLLRLNNNKYKSTTSFPPAITSPNTFYGSNYQDSKGADVKIIPQKANNEYINDDGNKGNEDKNIEPNDDGSLYGKYRSALINGYEGELTEYAENKNRDYYDPVVESIRYNPPSFNEEEENEDPNSDNKFHPKRERIEEKYVKHNLREERLEDVRTNSFGGSSDENDDYSTDSDYGYGNQSDNYDQPGKYVDDYPSELKPNSQSVPVIVKPFKSSPPQGGGNRYPPIRNGRHRERNKYSAAYRGPQNQQYLGGGGGGGYSDYDYGDEDRDKESSVPRVNEAHFNPTSHLLNHQQDKRIVTNCAKQDPLKKFPSNYQGGSQFRGRYKEYPSVSVNVAAGHSARHPKANTYYNSYYGKKNAFVENVAGPHSYHPYAPGHGYSSQSQEPFSPSTHFSSGGGIRLVNSAQIIVPYKPNLPHHGRYPRYKNGLALPVQNPPRLRGHRISYREIIPQRDGFTKIVKRYKTFVDHTPKRYVSSGEPYSRLL